MVKSTKGQLRATQELHVTHIYNKQTSTAAYTDIYGTAHCTATIALQQFHSHNPTVTIAVNLFLVVQEVTTGNHRYSSNVDPNFYYCCCCLTGVGAKELTNDLAGGGVGG